MINLLDILAIGLLVDEVPCLVDTGVNLLAVLANRILRFVEDAHRLPPLRDSRRHPSDVGADDPFGTRIFLLQASKNVDHSAIGAAPLRHTVDVTVVLVGPTAVGKSSLAVALGRRYAADGQPAEIVNADSMLVYRGMDIGTAKPSEVERAAIRHHVIDVLEVNQATTVAEFQQLARAAIADCEARGVIPIVVGGSALYVRAIVDDFRFPGTDPVIRARLESELSS